MKDISLATKIYRGRDHSCRCGCGGTYVTFAEQPKAFTRRVAEMKNHIFLGAEVDEEENYINISLPNDRALTAYFD